VTSDLRLFGSVFVTLLVIMDPPGSVPIFLSLTGRGTRRSRNRNADLAVLTALSVIVVFALFGQQVLQYLHVTLPAVQVAGGLLLLLVALELLMGWGSEPAGDEEVNVSMVPLGTPLLAGPGAIAATIVFAKGVHGVLRRSGVTLVTRVSGLLLSAIAVQLAADGIRAFVESG
jgi:multiple antibiotic resistance protein